ncbi:MAG: methylenetetrahydrofolate reductase C-terminal domain-containing protein [Sedimentisphaerales bacterium]|nr:methylenetetrahydrofolate reductase C-terminal domain-containing protein [Sedimentisphaerales bacterium]
MKNNVLRKKLEKRSSFLVFAELTGGPGFSYGPIEKFLSSYNSESAAGIPGGYEFIGITLPQSPGGVANLRPSDVIARLTAKKLLAGLEVLPHVTCKDNNSDAIISLLAGYRNSGLENVLLMTGDKPVRAKGVFELDSIGLLQLVRNINNESYMKARPEAIDEVHRFFPGSAVSPFKYTEASQMQQYYKMEKKIACGAKFLITQVGWDWRKSLELLRYLDEQGLKIPVFGNVYLLSTKTPAPRLMHDIKLPGCFVSDDFLAKIYSESIDGHLERAAQQVAMYRAIGAAGVDIGGVHDYDMFAKILVRAAQIGSDWEKYKDNLYWPATPGDGSEFYLYDRSGRKTSLSKPKKKFKQKFFNFFHRAILNPDYRGFHAFKKTMSFLGAEKGKGFVYSMFNASEKYMKYLLFDCQECGDCFLPENFGLCTIGGCEKGMDNAPCGDSTVDGRCGNNLDRVCIGEFIYQAAAAEKGGIEKLRATINMPRNPALEHTASILNYLFGKDHTMRNALISIGESIHASIPKTGKIMKQLSGLGPGAYTSDSEPLNYIKALIESQVADGADYIAINLDAFGESDPQVAVDMMVEYVKLVQKWGGGVPVCIDSSNDDVLKAGLKQWYDTGKKVRRPLINSIKVYTADKMLPLKKDYDFAFIGLLVSEEAATGPGGSHSVEELYSLAKQIFEKAVGQYGFKPADIFFDSTVFPLAIDMPMEPNVPGYTYRAFETIKKIRSDSKMKGVHCSLGVSNSVRDLPGRKIGVCRAYVAKAMEYGLDAGIVNAAHRYGTVEPAPELLELVDAFAKMDGSAEKMNKAMELIGKFCRENRKPV